MFLRTSTVILLTAICPIIIGMEIEKNDVGSGYEKIITENLRIKCTYWENSSKTRTVSSHLNHAIPIIALHPKKNPDPFKTITSSSWKEFFSQEWSKIFAYKMPKKPVNNSIMQALSNFNGTVVVLEPQKLHIFHTDPYYIVRAWYPDTPDSKDVFPKKSDPSECTSQYMSTEINDDRILITVTPSYDLKRISKNNKAEDTPSVTTHDDFKKIIQESIGDNNSLILLNVVLPKLLSLEKKYPASLIINIKKNLQANS